MIDAVDELVPEEHCAVRRVYISDTDASGLIFFGVVTRWIAEAHAELMSQLGFVTMSGGLATPTRNLTVDYRSPLRLHDVALHRAWVSEIGTTSFWVSHQLEHDDAVAIAARTVHVAVQLDDMTRVPVPEPIVRACIGVGGTDRPPLVREPFAGDCRDH